MKRRRAKAYYEAIERKIFEVIPSGTHSNVKHFLRQHEAILDDKMRRLKLNLDDLEDHVRAYPDTHFKSESEQLRMRYNVFHQILAGTSLDSK